MFCTLFYNNNDFLKLNLKMDTLGHNYMIDWASMSMTNTMAIKSN